MTLPKHITAKAFKASNGEFAWRRGDLEEAIITIRNSRQAILGGEVWLITNSGTWNGLIPAETSNNNAVWQWQTKTRSKAESWEAYCLRTADESLQAARSMNVEDETPSSLRERLRFNLTYTAEEEE
jgi:hypothetical protein